MPKYKVGDPVYVPTMQGLEVAIVDKVDPGYRSGDYDVYTVRMPRASILPGNLPTNQYHEHHLAPFVVVCPVCGQSPSMEKGHFKEHKRGGQTCYGSFMACELVEAR